MKGIRACWTLAVAAVLMTSSAFMSVKTLAAEQATQSNSELDLVIRKTLRDTRTIIRDAQRLQRYDVVDDANRLLNTERVLKLNLDQGRPTEELGVLLPQLQQRLHLLKHSVREAEPTLSGQLSRDLSIIQRDVQILSNQI